MYEVGVVGLMFGGDEGREWNGYDVGVFWEGVVECCSVCFVEGCCVGYGEVVVLWWMYCEFGGV